MRFFSGLLAVASVVASVAGERLLRASSLVTCMDNSSLTASQFDVVFTPSNNTVSYNVQASIEISGYITAVIQVYAYGIKIIEKSLNPCHMNLPQLCPVSPGQVVIESHSTLSNDIIGNIPGVAYTVPDIDLNVYVQMYDDSNVRQACIQAVVTNEKTVDHVGVKWATAVISGIGLLTSAVLSVWGSSYTAAHIATNSLSLFAYFQSVVIVCMQAVDVVPPIASSWAQNLAWSMGFIQVEFMQKIFRWYVQATGGNPTTYLSFQTISILVQKKRHLLNPLTDLMHPRFKDFLITHGETASNIAARSLSTMKKLTNIARADATDNVAKSSPTLLVLRGIKRMAFEADIEQTSVVLTGFTFFVFICVVITAIFGLMRLVLMFAFKDKFQMFRASWGSMLKGTILRLVFIAFPQLLIMSLWEFIERDSAAVIILAVFFLILSAGIITWNLFKVFVIGQRSIANHGTAAALLYSDAAVVHKYGFLYTQFEATHYYFVAYFLGYIGIKSCFIAFAQSSGKTQGLAIFLIELAYLILVCWKKPYMDKSTNVINIIIGVIMTINALFFLFFSNLFGQPMAVGSIMGVVFFVMNAAFSLVLLLFTLVTCGMVLFYKNPDSRYKPAKDDRASFIQEEGKNTVNAAGEFTALGEAVRADHDDDALLRRPDETASLAPSNPFSEKHVSANSRPDSSPSTFDFDSTLHEHSRV